MYKNNNALKKNNFIERLCHFFNTKILNRVFKNCGYLLMHYFFVKRCLVLHIRIYFLRVDESIFSCLPVALRGGREMSTVPEKQASSSASNKSFFIQNFSFFPHGLGDMQEQWQWFKALVIQGREWTTAFKDGLGGRIDMRKKGPIK